jgi:hypothetical protein
MLALQVNGQLIPVQQPVKLNLNAGKYVVAGLLGCSSLLRHTTPVSCHRLLPKDAQQSYGAGLAPGLLVVSLEE